MEVIKYLASVRDDIPSTDMKKLKASPICPAEAGPKGMESTQGSSKLYRVSDLYEPGEELRKLGLPIVQWPGPPGSYRKNGAEGRFLTYLGIKSWPHAAELIDMMASDDVTMRRKAMNYFIANHHTNSYGTHEMATSQKKFLPIVGGDEQLLVSPVECFNNENCAILGFSILGRDLSSHAIVSLALVLYIHLG